MNYAEGMKLVKLNAKVPINVSTMAFKALYFFKFTTLLKTIYILDFDLQRYHRQDI